VSIDLDEPPSVPPTPPAAAAEKAKPGTAPGGKAGKAEAAAAAAAAAALPVGPPPTDLAFLTKVEAMMRVEGGIDLVDLPFAVFLANTLPARGR
jgi:hypothetical protein